MKNSLTPWLMASALGAVWLGGCGTAPAPQPKGHTKSSTSTAKPKTTSTKNGKQLKVIAFYDQSMGTVTPDPFALIKAHPGVVSYLAPFWYEVSPTGSLIAKPEGNAATLAVQDHLPLIPLFTNAGGTDTFLHSGILRTNAIHNIVMAVKAKKYVGASIDFQLLKSTDKSDLTRFMQALSKAMPKSDILSMSVVPLTSGNGQSGAYDFKALNKVVGSMVLMAYDLHGNGTPPGPVAPWAWVKTSINTALKAGVQPSKLYLGIADYGYLWTSGSTKATTIPLKVMHQHKYGVYTWNPTYKEAYDKYTVKGTSHIIWFENDRAAADRIALAKKDHLGGVAFWRIGYEDAKWWDTVAKAIDTGGSSSGGAKGSANTAGSKLSPKHADKMMKKAGKSAKRDIKAPAQTITKAGDKAKRNIKGPAKKMLIAPTHKAKHVIKKTTGT